MKKDSLALFETKIFIVATLMLMVFMLFSCTISAPTSFYTLTPIQTDQKYTRSKTQDNSFLTVGIGPVNFPQYLNRSEIMTKVDKNRFELSEFHKWAEPLQDNFRQVLIENLSCLLKTGKLAILSWRDFNQLDYQVKIEVLQFQPTYKNKAVLKAQWMILKSEVKQPLFICQHLYQEPLKGKSYEAVVDALSLTTASLSKDIAESLRDFL